MELLSFGAWSRSPATMVMLAIFLAVWLAAQPAQAGKSVEDIPDIPCTGECMEIYHTTMAGLYKKMVEYCVGQANRSDPKFKAYTYPTYTTNPSTTTNHVETRGSQEGSFMFKACMNDKFDQPLH